MVHSQQTRVYLRRAARALEAQKITKLELNGLTDRQLNTARRLIQEHEDEIRAAWKEHFRG